MRDKKKETVRLAEKACAPVTRKELSERLSAKLLHNFSVQPQDATNENIYNALALVLRDLMRNKRLEFIAKAKEQQSKQVYYLCMEFLMGRSLKNSLYNLDLTETAQELLKKEYGVKLDTLYELEPDALGSATVGLGGWLPAFSTDLLPRRFRRSGIRCCMSTAYSARSW